MVRLHCVIRDGDDRTAPGIHSRAKLVKAHGEEMIDALISQGLASTVDSPQLDDTTPQARPIEELLDAQRDTLKSDELTELCKHYGLPHGGNKQDKLDRVAGFEDALDADLSTLEAETLDSVAAYFGVDAELDTEAKIAAIEEAAG